MPKKKQELSPKEIKSECEKIRLEIKNAELRLTELKCICKHKDTFEGLYSYRIGVVQPAIICSDCGVLIKYT